MTIPMQLLNLRVKPERLPLQPEDISSLIAKHPGNEDEKIHIAHLATWLCLLDDCFETAARVLDVAIYDSLGCQVPLEYKEFTPREAVLFPIPVRAGTKVSDLQLIGQPLEKILERRGLLLTIVMISDCDD